MANHLRLRVFDDEQADTWSSVEEMIERWRLSWTLELVYTGYQSVTLPEFNEV
jgi:hypothetical protein